MKVAVLFALSASAVATINCQIPVDYATASGTGCGAEVAGYQIRGFCVTGLDFTKFALTPASQVVATTFNAPTYTAAAPGTATGCTVPNPSNDWAGGAAASTAAPLSATGCEAFEDAPLAAGAEAFTNTESHFKGVTVTCAPTYFPTQGFEGNVNCGRGAAWTNFFTVTPADTSDYFFTNTWGPVDATGLQRGGTYLTGATTRLICSQGCVLPTDLCAAGVLNPFVLFTSVQGFDLATCTLRPTSVLVPTGISFVCAAAGIASTPFTVACNAGSTTAVTTYTANACGPVDGAVSWPIWNLNGVVNSWANPFTQTAGNIRNFPLVTSVRSLLFTLPASTSNTLRYWNNNPAQVLKDGNVYQIAVTGCDAVLATRTQCVQQTLNWWRCYHNFPFNEGTTCVAAGLPIACPTHELGFRCPTSSKKGLLGLLGLLGIIPLLLLCCCLLFLCCIRRRKTEADVHFATFDPHAAPVVGAPCATATAIPTAFGACATPYPTHSAIPVL